MTARLFVAGGLLLVAFFVPFMSCCAAGIALFGSRRWAISALATLATAHAEISRNHDEDAVLLGGDGLAGRIAEDEDNYPPSIP